ncbi:family 3 extracellular solute-binding protein [Bradyrhizobium oligotrophicum S58]|uniref:Family 3 extracellular solute-binding protein n=1 Tax=Bradyrhizobium oligotrophicum S58 TaxID=1245469 RepID=M4ZFX9_9BRAD|nr:hypothetical protein [Bradyrhizobium oligotrophicum]BAM92713.1 family 3 extracellular solute-binding protein [Bradyrhizobium oligotrophicum S58]
MTRSIISFGFAQAVLALLGLALAAGGLIWRFQRNRNEAFAGGVAEGSPTRKRLIAAILDETQSDWWDRLVFQYLGSKR